jgi:hypothetical protein
MASAERPRWCSKRARLVAVNLDLEATIDQGKRRRQPAYAAAGYEDLGFSGCFHSLLPFLVCRIALYRASGWRNSAFRTRHALADDIRY